MRDMDPQDRQAVITLGLGLILLALALFLFTRVLKFKAIVGVGD